MYIYIYTYVRQHAIEPGLAFSDWRELLSDGRLIYIYIYI